MRLRLAPAPLCVLALSLAGWSGLVRAEGVTAVPVPAATPAQTPAEGPRAPGALRQELPDIDLRPAPDARFAHALSCREIMGVVQRLQCYDGAMEGGGGLGPMRVAVGGGAGAGLGGRWVFHRQSDPFSGAELSWLRLGRLGDDGQGRLPGEGAPEAVILQCDGQGGFRLLVAGRGFLGAPGDALAVRYRFGSSPSVTEHWQVVGDGRVLMMPGAGSGFIAALQGGQDFLFETISYRGQRATARFAGAPEAAPGWAHVQGGCPAGAGPAASAPSPGVAAPPQEMPQGRVLPEGARWRSAASGEGVAVAIEVGWGLNH